MKKIIFFFCMVQFVCMNICFADYKGGTIIDLSSQTTGSVTSAQLPTVIKLYGTTTTQAAGAFGQLYVQSSSSGSDNLSDYVLMLKCDNAGTNTFVDSSPTPKTITAQGNAIGTSTVILESDSYLGDGTTDALLINDHADFAPGTGDFTIGYTIRFNSVTNFFMHRQFSSVSNYTMINYENNVSGANDIMFTYVVGGVTLADYRCEFNSPSTGTNYHFEIVRSGTNFYIFINGVSQSLTVATAISTNNLSDIAANVYLMAAQDLSASLNGYMDGFYYIKGRALHTTNFTSPTTQLPEYECYTQYSAKYADPVNGNTVFEILTTGTATTESSYIYNNVTTTVWGLGTNTAITGTDSGAYAGWSNRPIRVTGLDIGSSKEIKDNINTIKIKPDLLDAEGMAKQNYIEGAKAAWIAANQAVYTTVVNETGTGSVTYIDTAQMEADYANYAEGVWTADPNHDSYAKNFQKTYEKGFWQMFDSVTPRSWNPKGKPNTIRKGFVVEDMPDVVKGEDKQSIDIGAMIAYMALVQQTLKADTIFALSTLKELITTGTVTQQKIDYVNDRLEVLSP